MQEQEIARPSGPCRVRQRTESAPAVLLPPQGSDSAAHAVSDCGVMEDGAAPADTECAAQATCFLSDCQTAFRTDMCASTTMLLRHGHLACKEYVQDQHDTISVHLGVATCCDLARLCLQHLRQAPRRCWSAWLTPSSRSPTQRAEAVRSGRGPCATAWRSGTWRRTLASQRTTRLHSVSPVSVELPQPP
jgi:hypothetical protein